MIIGKLKTKSNIFLAPMSGVCNIAYRIQAMRYNCGLVYSEFVNATALARENEVSIQKIQTAQEERPVAIQLFGTDIPHIQHAVKLLQEKADIIDFNFGCPSHKVTNCGAGAAMLNQPEKVEAIINAMVNVSEKPITAKVRIGMNEKQITIKQIAQAVENGGGAAIAIHPRTLEQGYSGQANWKHIREVKEHVNIPVIGNGDVTTPEKAKLMFEETNCDAIMLGRAACGNPFIFKQITHYLQTGELLPQKDKFELFIEYLDIWKQFPQLEFSNLKVQANYFTKGIIGGSDIRTQLATVKNITELEDVMVRAKACGDEKRILPPKNEKHIYM